MFEISAAIQGLKQSFEIVKGLVDVRDDVKLRDALTEFNVKMHALSTAALTSIEKASAAHEQVTLLKEQLRELQAKLADRSQYELHEVATGIFVYLFQPSATGHKTPRHCLCQPCFDKGVKSVLRVYDEEGELPHWICSCDSNHNV